MDGLNAASGAIRAFQTGLDVTANNLANVNTSGFRSSSVEFETGPGGRGVEAGSISESALPGPVLFTGSSLNVAVNGDGFFAVRQASGRLAFTRDGSFTVDGQGRLVTQNGDLLDPQITIPRDATGVSFGRDGTVTAQRADGTQQTLGRIQPVRFANPAGLSNIGDNLTVPTAASGAGSRVNGEFSPGTIEGSNVDIATEMVNLIRDERATQVNAAAFRTQDETLGTILDLKR